MTFRHSLSQLGLPLVAGVWIGLGLAGMDRGEPARESAAVPDPLPAVGGSNGWAQHAPGTPPSSGPGAASAQARIRANVPTRFNPDVESPRVDAQVFLDPFSSVIGDVEIGAGVYVAPFASIRGDEGQPIHIGNGSNLQDGVVIHGLETVSQGEPVPEHSYTVQGKRYAVYVGERVSLAHQSQIHGPAWIEDDVFVGMQALIFKAHVEKGVVVEPGATIIGVTVAAGRYVPARAVVTTQEAADRLPEITYSYGLRAINQSMVRANRSLAESYLGSVPAAPGR